MPTSVYRGDAFCETTVSERVEAMRELLLKTGRHARHLHQKYVGNALMMDGGLQAGGIKTGVRRTIFCIALGAAALIEGYVQSCRLAVDAGSRCSPNNDHMARMIARPGNFYEDTVGFVASRRWRVRLRRDRNVYGAGRIDATKAP